MGFDDIGNRFRKISEAKAQEHPPEPQLDPAEARAIRERMLGVLIRDAREDSGFSVEDMAAYLGVAVDDYLAWEYGYGTPSLPLLEVLAYFLKIPVSHFWGTHTLQQAKLERQIDIDEYITLRTRMIGVMVRAQRESLGIPREDFANGIDAPLEHVEAFENGVYQIPMAMLQSMANALDVNVSHFLDESGRVAAFFEMQELIKQLNKTPEEVRDFIAVPSNEAYIRLAMTIANMPTETQRQLAESLLKNNPSEAQRKLAEGLLDITL
jgi:transcriptional regulator with XRE-family HTH domain